jgi:predicted nucleic-acid-binding protein
MESKTYFVDANYIIRYLIRDDESHYKQVLKVFKEAQKGRIKIILLDEIIAEVIYVLSKVYEVPREEILFSLSTLIETGGFYCKSSKDLLLNTLKIYGETNLDFVDILIYLKAQNEEGKILSFDNDFKKLEKLYD